ncbi:hypothetical protein [Mycoplasmopsis gallinacea]|uniref:Lipoprotein n=1 Tax=Mycoplasmopsis gallinacea TaxID=29556 RepID=A0A6H0V2E2_9BACT|nr:hypothetical protein [Mycoplasmopsis gallinacea]QIW62501.1 hypothetical protein GOQ20_03720 [Mycoplasmopsis gallinacea]
MIRKLIKLSPVVLTGSFLPFMVACNDKNNAGDNGEKSGDNNGSSITNTQQDNSNVRILKEFQTQNQITLTKKLAEKNWNPEEKNLLKQYSLYKETYVNYFLQLTDIVFKLPAYIEKVYNDPNLLQRNRNFMFNKLYSEDGNELDKKIRKFKQTLIENIKNATIIQKNRFKTTSLPYADVFEFTYFDFRTESGNQNLTVQELNNTRWYYQPINYSIVNQFTSLIYCLFPTEIDVFVNDNNLKEILKQIIISEDRMVRIEKKLNLVNKTKKTFYVKENGEIKEQYFDSVFGENVSLLNGFLDSLDLPIAD